MKLVFLLILLFSCSKENNLSVKNLYEEKKYIEVIKKAIHLKNDSEANYYGSLSITNLETYLRKSTTQDKENFFKLNESFLLKNGIRIQNEKIHSKEYITLKDIFQDKVDAKKKLLIEKFLLSNQFNYLEENLFYISQILNLSTKIETSLYSNFIFQVLKTNLIEKVSEEEKNIFWKETENLSSLTYHELVGKNVNMRTGPGVENSGIAKLNDEILLELEKDITQTQIGDKQGVWIQVYSKKSSKSGWVFSAFLKPIPNKKKDTQEKVSNYRKIDFENWEESSIPPYFYGDYIPSEKIVQNEKIGLSIYSGKSETKICTKLNSFQTIKFEIDLKNIKEKIQLFEIKWEPNLKIIADTNYIYFNQNQIKYNQEIMKSIEINLDKDKIYYKGIEILKIQKTLNPIFCIYNNSKSKSSAILYTIELN